MARDAARRLLKRPRLLPALLAATLLSTQVAGLAHALSHYNADALAKERIAHASLCAKCAHFHKLSVAVPPNTPPETRAAVFMVPPTPATPAALRCVAAAFLARAPPDFV
jgi:hypothetical protein